MRFISKAAAKVQFFFDSAKCFDHKKMHRLSTSNFFALCLCRYSTKKVGTWSSPRPYNLCSMLYVLCSFYLSVQPL